MAVLAAALLLALAGGWWLVRGWGGAAGSYQGATSANVPPGTEEVAAHQTAVAPQEIPPGARTELPAFADAVDTEAELRGVVVTPLGAPIAGAQLTVTLPLDRQAPGLLEPGVAMERKVAEGRSGPDGRFRIALERYRPHDLLAESPGHARTKLPNVGAGEDLVVVLAPAAILHGRVLDASDGQPLEGALVEAIAGTMQGYGSPRWRTETDAAGRYRFDALAPEYYRLNVEAERHVKDWGGHCLVLSAGEERAVDLLLERGTSIRGQVRDGRTGEAIAGARVRLRTGSHDAVAGPDGRYTLEGVPIGYNDDLAAQAPGYGSFSFPVYMVPEEGLDQDILLQPGRRVIGRVIDRDGVPVAGAFVTAAARSLREGRSQSDAVRTRSDADGRFVLQDLRVDLRHTLFIEAEGHAAGVFDSSADEWFVDELDFGDVVLERPGMLAGRVVDAGGQPLADLWVLLSGEPRRRDHFAPALGADEGYLSGPGFGLGAIPARTDARGRFAFPGLPSGEYYLDAGRKGFARRAALEVALAEGEQRFNLELVLDMGLLLEGRVVDRDGRPMPAASVSLFRDDTSLARLTYNLTDQDGRFRLTGLDPGTYTLAADHGFGHERDPEGGQRQFGEARLSGIAAGTHDVVLVLPDAAPISGVVLGPDGEPLAGASILLPLESGAGMQLATTTDRQGRFTIWTSTAIVDLTVHPPYGPLGAYLPIVDPAGRVDESFDVVIAEVAAGSEDLMVRLPRLP